MLRIELGQRGAMRYGMEHVAGEIAFSNACTLECYGRRRLCFLEWESDKSLSPHVFKEPKTATRKFLECQVCA